MKKPILIAVFFVVCLFIAGCISRFESAENYRTGYDGVNIDFSVFPQNDVFENEKFNVQLEAWNRGAYDTSNLASVVLYDSGFFSASNPVVFKFNDAGRSIVHGRSTAYPEGEFISTPVIDFASKEIFMTDYQRFDFIARLCYEYRTIATIEACIGRRTGFGSCDFSELNRELNLSQGQGAPLAITSVEETILESGNKVKPSFTFIIENKGSGEVFRNPETNVENYCTGYGLEGNSLDRFDISFNLSTRYSYDSRTSTNSFTCRPSVPKLDKGTANITCTLNDEIDAGSAYVTPLYIELIYGYSIKAKHELVVRRS